MLGLGGATGVVGPPALEVRAGGTERVSASDSWWEMRVGAEPASEEVSAAKSVVSPSASEVLDVEVEAVDLDERCRLTIGR